MIGEFYIIKMKVNSFVKRNFTNEKDMVIDIGCGKNPYYHDSIQGQITCIDIYNTGKADVVADASFLPFKDSSFDKAISVNSIYYFKNPLLFAEKVSKMIKKNGKIIVITPFMYPIHDASVDKYRFTEHGLRTVFEDYFRIEKVEQIGGIFNMPSVFLHSLLKGIPLLSPKFLKPLAYLISYILFYIPYLAVQLLGVLDFFDRSKRWSTYFAIVAARK